MKSSTKRLLKFIWYLITAFAIYIVSYYFCVIAVIVAAVNGIRGFGEGTPFLCALPIAAVFFLFATAGITKRKNITFIKKTRGPIIYKLLYTIRQIARFILPIYIVVSFIYIQASKIKYYRGGMQYWQILGLTTIKPK